MNSNYEAFLKNHNIQYLLFGQFVSLIGERMSTLLFFSIAISIIGHDSSFLATLLIAIQVLPLFFFGYLFGTLADRYNKKLILILCDILRTLLIIGLIIYHSSLTYLYLTVFLIGFFYALFEPTRKAFIPYIVREEHLIPFNRILAVSEILGMIIGLAIGIFALSFLSIQQALIINTITYLFSMIMVVLIKYSTHKNIPSSHLNEESKKFKAGFLEGIKHIKNNNNARVIITNLSLITFFSAGLYYAALSDYSIRATYLGIDPGAQMGIFLISIALGAFTAPLLKRFIEHFKDSDIVRSVYFLGGLSLIFCSTLMILNLDHFLFVISILFISGIAVGTNYLRVLYLFHLNVKKKFLGRVLSINEIVLSLSVVLGIILGSFFNEIFTYSYGFLLAGIMYFSGFLLLSYEQKFMTW